MNFWPIFDIFKGGGVKRLFLRKITDFQRRKRNFRMKLTHSDNSDHDKGFSALNIWSSWIQNWNKDIFFISWLQKKTLRWVKNGQNSVNSLFFAPAALKRGGGAKFTENGWTFDLWTVPNLDHDCWNTSNLDLYNGTVDLDTYLKLCITCAPSLMQRRETCAISRIRHVTARHEVVRTNTSLFRAFLWNFNKKNGR